jgi:hypothetical protein
MLDRKTLIALGEADPESVGDHWRCLQEVITTALELYGLEEPELPADPLKDPILGEEGYPSDVELQRIKTWDPGDLIGLFAYIERRWAHKQWRWHALDNLFSISTGGWSGNEDLIFALQDNRAAWAITWRQSRRGGHFEFEIPQEMIRRLKMRAKHQLRPSGIVQMTPQQLEQERRIFLGELVGMKNRAGRLGLWRTTHALDAATSESGYELADILTGKQVDTVAGRLA